MDNDISNLQKVFGKVEPVDTKYLVRCSVKHYPMFTQVFIPKTPYLKTLPFIVKNPQTQAIDEYIDAVRESHKQSNETNVERSLRKTKQLIKDYALCNEFDLFCTLTFSQKKIDRLNAELVGSDCVLIGKELRWTLKKPYDCIAFCNESSNWLTLADELRTVSMNFDKYKLRTIKEVLAV